MKEDVEVVEKTDEVDTEITIKVRHKPGETKILDELRKLTVVGTNHCTRHGTILLAGFTDSEEDGIRTMCVYRQCRDMADTMIGMSTFVERMEDVDKVH